MTKKILLKIVELLFGLLIGFLVYRFSGSNLQNNLNGLFGIIAGLLSTLILAIFIESEATRKKIGNLNYNLQNLKEILLKKENYKINLIKLLNEKPVVFEKNDVPQLWLDLLWEIDNKFWATTYINPSEGWEQVYTKIGNDIQRAKIYAKDADIRRIFIIDNKDELKRIEGVIKEQIKLGIKSKYIYKDEINNKSFLKSFADRSKSLDFCIVDNKFIVFVYINKKRMINRAEIGKMNKTNEYYTDFYKNLFKEAKEL
jgi:hypothetical protein